VGRKGPQGKERKAATTYRTANFFSLRAKKNTRKEETTVIDNKDTKDAGPGDNQERGSPKGKKVPKKWGKTASYPREKFPQNEAVRELAAGYGGGKKGGPRKNEKHCFLHYGGVACVAKTCAQKPVSLRGTEVKMASNTWQRAC